MKGIFKLVACLFVLLSFNTKALVINGCTIEANTSCYGANLSGADLSDVNLNGANLTFTDLSDANLSGANLSGANLSSAHLSGANLTNAYLLYADLLYADLTDANLTGASLHAADLSGANLNGVSGQLSSAQFITLPSGYTLEGLVIKPDSDNDGFSDQLEIAISGDATSVDSTTFAATLTNLTADADNDGVPDDYETAAGGNTTSSTFESVLAMLTTNKNVPAMGGIGLLALGLSMLGLGAVRMRRM